MNPLVLFLPTFRASTTAYLLGLVVLAVLDYARLTYGLPLVPGWLGMLAMWFFVFSLHANRRRHAGENIGLAFLPILVAIVVKGIGSAIGFFPGVYASMVEFAESNGIDTSDQQALAEAMNEPGFQTAWQAELEADPDAVAAMLEGTAMPSFFAFWLIIAIFAIWFAQMKKSGGSIEDAPTLAPATAPAAPAAETGSDDNDESDGDGEKKPD